MNFVCAVCATATALEIISFPSYPTFLVPVPRDLAAGIVKAPLTLVACTQCGHFQVPHVDQEVQRLLYDVYYRHYEVDTLETMIPAYRTPFNRMVEALAAEGILERGALLEIGCSSGAMTGFLMQFCLSYTGIDPSERIEIARSRYPAQTFIRSYFPAAEVQGPFDVAVSQFNLEHIEKVGDFVTALAAVVRPGGLLLLQVPDAGYYLRNGQPNFLAHEHVHYFRRGQLQALLQARGFEIVIWGEEGASIMCAARRHVGTAAATTVSDPLADAIEMRALSSQRPEIPARPVFYGVGLTLHWLLALRPSIAAGALVVDDNPRYHGMGVPGYDLPILEPSPEVFDGREVVLTLNSIYFERVLERLMNLGVRSRVHHIGKKASSVFVA